MRKPGYYWLKSKGKWGVAEWYVSTNFSLWFIPGDNDGKRDSDFEKIDENRIERNDEPAAHRLGYTPDQL